jgi:nitric oxide reductase subunit C
MLSLYQAKWFFLGGTAVSFLIFFGLTAHTFTRIPELSNQEDLTEQVARGKHLWDDGNCMGCHTILGEGGYYAPEMTKVYERRGAAFIRAMLEDPQAMYPGERKMQEYDYSDEEIDALIAFFEWVGRIDTNGFPPEPYLVSLAVPATPGSAAVAAAVGRPKVFNQMCIACHSLGGQGGQIGPALDTVGDRLSREEFVTWLEEPQKVKPGTTMPDLPLSDAEVKELAAFLVQLRTDPKSQPAGG